MGSTEDTTNANEEYVEMSCTSKDEEEVLILPNGSTGTGAPLKDHRYDIVADLDEDVDTMEPPPQTLHLLQEGEDTSNEEVFILSNNLAASACSPHKPQQKNKMQENGANTKWQTLGSKLSHLEKEEEKAEDSLGEDHDLLDSIIHCLQERTEGDEKDTDFLAVQMKELETTYKTGNEALQLSMMSSLPNSHTYSSRRRSKTERGSKFAPSMESLVEVATSSGPYQQISIYDECHTTSKTMVTSNTGGKETRTRKFSFSRKCSQAGGEGGTWTKATGKVRESHHVGACVDISERGRVGATRGSVVSMPGGREESGGGWRERVRDRFFSYSAGDYVKMHPAPLHH